MKLTLGLKVTLSITITAIVGFLIFGILQYQTTKNTTLQTEEKSHQGKLNSIQLLLASYINEKQIAIHRLQEDIAKHLNDEQSIAKSLELVEKT